MQGSPGGMDISELGVTGRRVIQRTGKGTYAFAFLLSELTLAVESAQG
jgi:hypothetical protein